MEQVNALPGVTGAGVTQILPMRGGGWSSGIRVEGTAEGEVTTTFVRMVTPGYLDAMGIELHDGRMFTDADRQNAPNQPRIIINDALAKKYFAGTNPIGRRISTGMSDSLGIVIGVVNDVAEGHLTDAAAPARYMLYESFPFVPGGDAIVFRTSGRDAESALEDARAAVRRAIAGAGVEHVSTMEREFAKAVGPARQVMMLLTILTALALVLGAVGVYGVISHFVSRRSRDWGVRLALGMMPGKVIRMIIMRGTGLVSLGIVIGIAAFFALARLLGSLLYGVGAADPIAMATATVVLLVVGVLAAAVPGLRASRTDPAIVLREQ